MKRGNVEHMQKLIINDDIDYVAEVDKFRVRRLINPDTYMYLTDVAFMRLYGTITGVKDIEMWLECLRDRNRLYLKTDTDHPI